MTLLLHCNLVASAIIRRAAPAARPKPVIVRKMSYFLTNPTVSPSRFADQVLFLGESAESLVQPCGAPNLKASGAIVFFERSPGLEHRSNTNSAGDPSTDSQLWAIVAAWRHPHVHRPALGEPL